MAKQFRDSYSDLPSKAGLVSIIPQIHWGKTLSITIAGDRDGLIYLAKVLHYMADIDVEKRQIPIGARAHLPLHLAFN